MLIDVVDPARAERVGQVDALHVAARLVRTARRTILGIDRTWPWAHELAAVYTRLVALPRPIG